MEKSRFNTWIRVVAVTGALLMMIGAAGMLPQGAASAHTSGTSFYAEASGIAADTVLLTVDGQDVTAEEYLYYVLSYGYQYYSYYAMTGTAVDWTMPVEEGSDMTLTDLIMAQAQEGAVQDAVIRKMAADNGILVTQEDKDSFRLNIQEMKAMYGEDFQTMLMTYGLTESLWELRNNISCLSAGLQSAYISGKLRPDDAALLQLVDEHGLTTARSMLVSTAYLENEAIEQARASATDYRARILAADDMTAEIIAVNSELGIAEEDNIASLYHCGHDHGDSEEDTVCATLSKLKVGELSEVIEADDGFYVLLREDIDMDAVAQVQFSEDLNTAIADAVIEVQGKNMESLNVGAFIENFMALLATRTAAE